MLGPPGCVVTLLRGYSHELGRTIHLCLAASLARSLCDVAMLVVYVQEDSIPLMHPRICPACLTRALGSDTLQGVSR